MCAPEDTSYPPSLFSSIQCPLPSNVGRDIVRDILTQASPLSMEALTGVACTLQGLVFVFELGQHLVELIVVRTVHVVCKLYEF